MAQPGAVLKHFATGLVICVVAGGLILFLVPSVRETVWGWFRDKDQTPPKLAWELPVKLIGDSTDRAGLRISDEAMANLEVNPVEVKLAEEPRPLPPQVGTVNYDNDYLFTIRPRFAGEMVEFLQVKLDHSPYWRDVRFGDTVKQGAVLGVLWSKDLGMAKADLVDAIIAKKLSADRLQRHLEAFEQGALALATLRESEAKAATDRGAYAKTLRPLMMWKLPKEDIDAVEKEAETIAKEVEKTGDPIKARNIDDEVKRWARVEIKAPVFARDKGEPDPKRVLVVLEKNSSVGETLDPGRDTPLFRLADLTRLQIWVHPPEEYLPLIRQHLNGKNGGAPLRWEIRFQADPPGTKPLELTISQMSPSLDPTLHTPMLIGYLDNPERKYLVGQFVTATILAPPPKNTVEVPTDAINLVESQSLVFARNKDGKQNEYFLRRVVTAQSAGKFTLVRTQLTPEDERLSRAETAKGRRPLDTLQPGDVVLTRGVVELTAALEDLLTNPGAKRE